MVVWRSFSVDRLVSVDDRSVVVPPSAVTAISRKLPVDSEFALRNRSVETLVSVVSQSVVETGSAVVLKESRWLSVDSVVALCGCPVETLVS